MKKLIIEGITPSGKAFRPSDWAERMSGCLSTFRNQRIIYSPLLKPGIYNGNKCVIIDYELQSSNPDLFQQMLDFAKINQLNVVEEEVE